MLGFLLGLFGIVFVFLLGIAIGIVVVAYGIKEVKDGEKLYDLVESCPTRVKRELRDKLDSVLGRETW